MADALMTGVSDPTAARAWAAVSDTHESYATPDGVVLDGTAWLVTAGHAD